MHMCVYRYAARGLTPRRNNRQPRKRVLGAYATHNKAVGYCQSMNYLVAHMLIFLGEEESFWLLARPAYPSPSPDFVPGLPHVTLIELRLALIFVPGLQHVSLIELRLALISYQDYHILLLTLAGRL